MANCRMEIKVISRLKGHSIARQMSYISGQKIYDTYNGKEYSQPRDDVLFCKIYQPDHVPHAFCNLQFLCNKINEAEKRYDARTGRKFIGSLPNELPVPELIHIVSEYIRENFVKNGLCAIAAIHEGRDESDPSKNNPHVHIIVSTRTVGPNGFSKKKDREHDKRKYVYIWRKSWADAHNRAYERNGLEIRVSHESLEVQGVDREPIPHLSLSDWLKEKSGVRTPAGEQRRAAIARNEARSRQKTLRQEREMTVELTR